MKSIFWQFLFQNGLTLGHSKGKGKSKVLPRTGHECPEGEQRYSSTLPSASALDGGGRSTPRPGHFTPEKDPVPIVEEAGWAPELVWTDAENLARTGIRSRAVQPVARRYTDWALPPTPGLCRRQNYMPFLFAVSEAFRIFVRKVWSDEFTLKT